MYPFIPLPLKLEQPWMNTKILTKMKMSEVLPDLKWRILLF